jgi:hypothetical protein
MCWCSAERFQSRSLSPWTAPQPSAVCSGDHLIGARFKGNRNIDLQLDRGQLFPASSHPMRTDAARVQYRLSVWWEDGDVLSVYM